MNQRFQIACRWWIAALLILPAAAQAQKRDRAPAPPAQRSTSQILAEASEALRAGDEEKAAALFESASKRPDFAASRPSIQLFLAAGNSQILQGTRDSLDAALQIFGQAMDLYGENMMPLDRAMLRLKRAQVMMRQGRTDSAREELAQVRRKPLSRRALVYADLGDAELLLLANQPDAARERLLALIESEDANIAPLAMFDLGRAHVQLKQTDQAIAVFRKLWNRYGESEMVKRAIFLVGQIYFDRGDFLEARKLYEACSVVGATMQDRVRLGDELIVKVSDANHFNRTRSATLVATLVAPSGDKETLRLEKNPVSEQLYIGRIRTMLGAPAPGDGVLQVSGSDTIEISYAGPSSRTYKVRVVDDGAINIDNAMLPDPPPRRQSGMQRIDPAAPRSERPTVAAARQGGGMLNPGSPVYVQVIDADLDTTPQPDTIKAEVVAQGGGKDNTVPVLLTETGPRTGVFVGSVPTAPSGPTITASSEAVGHPPICAIDVDRDSPAPATSPSTRPAPRGSTFWQAKTGDAAPFIEIDLHQSAALSKLVWGAGEDRLAARNMPTDLTIRVKGDGPERIIKLADQSHPANNTIDLQGVMARTIRIEIAKFKGEAPAIGQIILTDTQGNQLLPTEEDVAAGETRTVLTFNVGQTVFARYTDEFNDNPGRSVVRESRRLGARYHNATMSIVKPGNADEKTSSFHPAWRLDFDSSPYVLLSDPDLDLSPNPDTAKVEVFSESGDSQVLELRETGADTGAFAAPLTLSANPDAKDNPRILHVRLGDFVWMKCFDEKNMQPGYKTFRYFGILENQPTAGQWEPLPLVTTPWPFEVKPEEGEPEPVPPVITRSPGKGRLTLAVRDPDAMCNAATGVPARVNCLLGNASLELNLSCTAPGVASQQVDLVLSDPLAERRVGDNKTITATELAVAGDDIVRLSYTDVRIPTADLQTRRVIDDDPGKTKARPKAPAKPGDEAQPVIPLISLSDPQRQALAAQDKHLAELRDELNARFAGYTAERKLFDQRRATLLKRQAALPKSPAPATAPSDGATSEADLLKAAINSVSSQIDLLDARLERLKALGATGAPRAAPATRPATRPAAAPAAPSPADALLVPGEPFDLVIDDPDLTAATLDVRIRSTAGRLVDKLTVAARRDETGKYRARIPTKATDDPEVKGAITLLPGGELIADYQDTIQKAPQNVERVAYVAMGSDAVLSATNAGYFEPVSKVRLGEPVYLQLIDFDADRSPGIDQVVVEAKTSTGDRMIVTLFETEPHSGIFRAKIQTDNGPANPDDDVLQANYGGAIDLVYHDYVRASPDSPEEKSLRVSVSGGTDGAVEGFSRHFKDAQEEMKLWYRTGQSAYQIGRRLYLAGAFERAQEYLGEATDYFSQLVSHFPEDPLAASANYYVGNIQSLKGNHREALARYQEIVSRWPKSEFVARARYKVGQEMETLGYFDQAVDAYVLLTYHHPDDPHVPMAMIRIMNRYERLKQFDDATAVAQKFVEKFPKHDQAGAVAARAGIWLALADRLPESAAWFTQAEKEFAASDKDMPGLLYSHAMALLHMQTTRHKSIARPEKIRELLDRVVYDYPKSSYAQEALKAKEQAPEPR